MNLGILLLPSCPFRYWTQIILLSDKCPYPSNHFNSPMYSNLIKLLGGFFLIYCTRNCHNSRVFLLCVSFSQNTTSMLTKEIKFCYVFELSLISLLLIPKVHTEIRSSNQLWSIRVKDKIYLTMCPAHCGFTWRRTAREWRKDERTDTRTERQEAAQTCARVLGNMQN